MAARAQSGVCLLLALLVVASAASDNITPARSLLQTPGFPFCQCDTDTIYNPNRLSFPSPGIVTVDGEEYIQFFITTVPVPIPPSPTLCSEADVGKIEWEVAATARVCSRFALVGDEQRRQATIFETIAGNFKLKVTNLDYTQQEIQDNGNAIPVLLNIRDGCSFQDIFPTVAITCDSTPGSNSYLVETEGIAYGISSQLVELRIYRDMSIACDRQVGMDKLEINVNTAANAVRYRRSIRNAFIGGRKTDAIYWEPHRRTMKFTNLQIPCTIDSTGIILAFEVVNGYTMEDICSGPLCQYAAFDTSGVDGTCPVGFFQAA